MVPVLCLPVLLVAANPPAGPAGPLYEACGQDPYLEGKHGFKTLVQAKEHAYLYLINNHGRLIQFKAHREIDPGDGAALATMPVQPRLLVDWVD
jgi:hypothetical protein